MDNPNFSSESQNLQQQTVDFARQLSKDLPPLFKNVWRENLEELEKELVQNPNLVNKERNFGDAPIHIATKGKKLGSLKTLLKNGAEVSLLDAVGETALHIAVSKRWDEGIQELLQHGASPDKLSEPKTTGNDFPQTALHIAIRKGDNQSTTLLLQQSPDLSLCDGFQRTVLHMAAEAHSIILFTRLLDEPSCHKMISQKDYKGNTALHIAIQMGKIEEEQKDEMENKILQIVNLLILENGADVDSINLAGETPVYLAAKNRLPKVVETLLKSDVNLSLVTKSNNTVLHAACESDCNKSLNLLLETGKLKKMITAKNDDQKEPFQLAIDSGSKLSCESLLSNGDFLGNVDCNGNNRCSLILDYLPNPLELLNRVFDKHIKVSKKSQNDPKLFVEFDYSVILKQRTEEIQSSLIPDLTSSQFTQLLKHPLIESFLVSKWNRLKFLFYIYVFLYFTFVLAHTYFIFCTWGPAGAWHKNWNQERPLLLAIWIIHIILYTIFLVPGTAMVLYNKHFIKDKETYCILMSIVISAFVVFSPNLFIDEKQRDLLLERPVAALSAAVMWGEFTLLLGKFPKFGQYISMLSTVATNMIKVLIAYSSLLVGFGLGFAIIYRDQNVFASFMHTLVKVLLMMIGEYNYVEMPGSEEKAKDSRETIMYLGFILLVAFLFGVSILMTNLIIGVAVYDIKELIHHGKINRLYNEAKYIIAYEKGLEFCLNNQLGRSSAVLDKIGKISPKKTFYPNRPGIKIDIPKDAINDAIKIKEIEIGKDDFSHSDGATDTTAILRSFSKFYMTNLQKQSKPRELKAKQHKLLSDHLDNFEKLLKSHLSKT